MSPLRAAAAFYRDLGWAVVPVIDKKPRVSWKTPPAWQKVEELIDDPETTGLAVILGEPSGDLVARDFDQPGAFEKWKRDHPGLAHTLPIARTGRLEGGYHVYGTMPDAPLKKLPDGELRGNGAIVVLPPSRHPTGSNYEWINQPVGQPSVVTPAQLNVVIERHIQPSRSEADPKQSRSRSEADPKQTKANTSIAYVEYDASIDRCILKNLPCGPGQRNQCLFDLAMDIRGLLPMDTPRSYLLEVVKKWHVLALPFIRTKGLVETISDFLIAWGNVRWPSGTLWRSIIEEAIGDTFTLAEEYSELNSTARILRALARHHRGGPFPLASRKLAEAIGVDCPKTALSRLRVLAAIGLVELVQPGERKRRGSAAVWRWLGPID